MTLSQTGSGSVYGQTACQVTFLNFPMLGKLVPRHKSRPDNDIQQKVEKFWCHTAFPYTSIMGMKLGETRLTKLTQRGSWLLWSRQVLIGLAGPEFTRPLFLFAEGLDLGVQIHGTPICLHGGGDIWGFSSRKGHFSSFGNMGNLKVAEVCHFGLFRGVLKISGAWGPK